MRSKFIDSLSDKQFSKNRINTITSYAEKAWQGDLKRAMHEYKVTPRPLDRRGYYCTVEDFTR